MVVPSRNPGEKAVIGNGIIAIPVRIALDAPHQVHIPHAKLVCWEDEPANCDEPTQLDFVCDWQIHFVCNRQNV